MLSNLVYFVFLHKYCRGKVEGTDLARFMYRIAN